MAQFGNMMRMRPQVPGLLGGGGMPPAGISDMMYRQPAPRQWQDPGFSGQPPQMPQIPRPQRPPMQFDMSQAQNLPAWNAPPPNQWQDPGFSSHNIQLTPGMFPQRPPIGAGAFDMSQAQNLPAFANPGQPPQLGGPGAAFQPPAGASDLMYRQPAPAAPPQMSSPANPLLQGMRPRASMPGFSNAIPRGYRMRGF